MCNKWMQTKHTYNMVMEKTILSSRARSKGRNDGLGGIWVFLED